MKESVLVAYVSIGNESRRLQNSQLDGMGNAKLVQHSVHSFGAPSCATSLSWSLWKFTVTFINTHAVTITPGSSNQPLRNLGSHLQETSVSFR